MLKNMDELPKWDVAIEGMVNEENKKKNRPLSLEDFKGLAKAYDFRLDDIFETVLLMVKHGVWAYDANPADQKKLDHETLIEYCIKKRIKDEELEVFQGDWSPIKQV